MNRLKRSLPVILLLVSILSVAGFAVIAQSQNGGNKNAPTKDDFGDNLNLGRIFRLVNSLNKEADKQQTKGFSKRAEMVRNYFQKKTGISDDARMKLSELAGNFQKERESINNAIKEVRRNQKNKPNDEALTSELRKLRESRNKLYDASREFLNKDLAKDDFERVLKFLREQIIKKVKNGGKSKRAKSLYEKTDSSLFKNISYNQSNGGGFIDGYSFIDYDAVGNEVWAQSITEGTCLVSGGDNEDVGNECRGASVHSILSDADGTGVAIEDGDGADNYAEVFFYWTPIIQGTYCVDAEHNVEDTDYTLLYAQSYDCMNVEFPEVETPTVNILRNGNVITGTTQEAVVGQKIELSAVISNGTGTNPQWTIDGEKVKNYVVTITNGNPVSATKTDLTSQDLNQSSVWFYWIDGGQHQVQYTATINGMPYTVTATFDVKRPTVTVSATTNTSTIYTSFDHQELLFGRGPVFGQPALRGINFSRENFQVPTGFSGDTIWVQTISYSYTRTLADGQTTETASGIGLDSRFPYSSDDPNALLTGDLPGVCLKSCANGVFVSKMQAQIDADMWLMFKPKNLPNGEESIYVPLKKVSWNWSATATRGTDNQFTLTTSSNSQNPVAEDSTNFPEWSNIVTGAEPYQ